MHSTVFTVRFRVCRSTIFVSHTHSINFVNYSVMEINTFHLYHRTECFCGHSMPEHTIKLADPECNYKCSGDSKQLCGGYFTISIFETGIKRKKFV